MEVESLPSSIPKTPPVEPVLDFAKMRGEALELLARFAGKSWTDHNIHDPGITMLEAKAYALTELGLRANLPIERILDTGDLSLFDGPDANFYLPQSILPNPPLTLEDFQKQLIDFLIEDYNYEDEDETGNPIPASGPYFPIQNAWLSQTNSAEKGVFLNPLSNSLSLDTGEQILFNGLYEVRLQFREHPSPFIGNLNNNIEFISFPANGINYTAEIAFPYWDELPDVWQNDLFSSLPEVSTSELMHAPDSGPEDFFAIINIESASEHPLGVYIRITSGIADPTNEIPAIISALDALLQTPGGGPVVSEVIDILRRYNQQVIITRELVIQVIDYLSQYRNLATDFVRFSSIRQQDIALDLDFEVTDIANIEEIIEAIFLSVDQFLEPNAYFQSLEEAQKEQEHLSDLFEGPLLSNGWIQADSLTENINAEVLYTSDLIRLIMALNVDASDKPQKLLSVGRLRLSNFMNNQLVSKDVRNCLNLYQTDLYKPRLSITKSRILVRREGEIIKEGLSIQEIELIESSLRAARLDPDRNRKGFDPLTYNPAPVGEHLSLDNYHSLQYEFPAVYGLGNFSLSSVAASDRLAKVKQLQAYLAFADQLLANTGSQLEHTRDLFTFSASEIRSYYSQALYELPGAEDLIYAFVNGTHSDWDSFIMDPNNAYVLALSEASESRELALERRERVLNHMLSRIGESTQSFDTWQSSRPDAEAGVRIRLKERLLSEYASLSSRRNLGIQLKSDNPTPLIWGSGNVAGLARRVGIKSGISNLTRRSLSTASFASEAEGLFLLEHILLRPRTTNDPLALLPIQLGYDEPEISDPYSFRISFLLPGEAPIVEDPENFRFGDPGFRKMFEKVVREETPAYIRPSVFWLSQTQLALFETAYQNWLTSLIPSGSDGGINLRNLVEVFTSIIQSTNTPT